MPSASISAGSQFRPSDVLRRGSGGRIVLIGSINGSRGKFGTSAYSASKAGLLGLAKSVAKLDESREVLHQE